MFSGGCFMFNKKWFSSVAVLGAFGSSIVATNSSTLVFADSSDENGFDCKFSELLKLWLDEKKMSDVTKSENSFLKLKSEYVEYLKQKNLWTGSDLPKESTFDDFVKSRGYNLGLLVAGVVTVVSCASYLFYSIFKDIRRYFNSNPSNKADANSSVSSKDGVSEARKEEVDKENDKNEGRGLENNINKKPDADVVETDISASGADNVKKDDAKVVLDPINDDFDDFDHDNLYGGNHDDIIDDDTVDDGRSVALEDMVNEDRSDDAGVAVDAVSDDNFDSVGAVDDRAEEDRPDNAGAADDVVNDDDFDSVGAIDDRAGEDQPDDAGVAVDAVSDDNFDSVGAVDDRAVEDRPDDAGVAVDAVSDDNFDSVGAVDDRAVEDRPDDAGAADDVVEDRADDDRNGDAYLGDGLV